MHPLSGKEFTRLRANFYEMALVSKNLQNELFAEKQTRVFHKEYCKILPSKKMGDPAAILLKIRDIFIEQLVVLKNANALYYTNLDKELTAHAFSVQDKSQAKNTILKFCSYLNPVMKHFFKEKSLPYIDYLCHSLKKKEIQKEFHESKLVQKIKDFEIVTHAKMPLKLIYKLAISKPLKVKETKKIQGWLKQIQVSENLPVRTFHGKEKNPLVKVRFFHRMLSDLISQLKEMPLVKKKPLSLIDLERSLTAYGCPILQSSDSRLIEKRKNLTGQCINTDKAAYLIGKAIYNPANDPDEKMIYLLEDNPAALLEVDKNEAVKTIKIFEDDLAHFGIIQAQTLWIDPTGAFSLIERCSYRLSDIRWKSTGPKICSSDLIEAEPIVGLLEGLAIMPCTPYPLEPEYFAFNHDNEMRALCCMPIKERSYEDLVLFTWKLSSNPDKTLNETVFTYLIHTSKLSKMAHVKLYRKLVSQALNEKDIDSSVTWKGQIKHEQILAHRKNLFLKIQEIHSQLKEAVSSYFFPKEKETSAFLKQAISDAYFKYCPGHLLLPQFFSLCKQELLSRLLPELKQEFFLPLKKQLVEEFLASSLGNPQVIKKWEEPDYYQKWGIYHPGQQKDIFKSGLAAFRLKSNS